MESLGEQIGIAHAPRVLRCLPTRETCVASTARWASICSVMANYARGRSPTKTRYRPATSEVNKQLTASKLCTQPARAAFNPAHTVNIDLRASWSSVPTHHYGFAVAPFPTRDRHSGNLRRVVVVASTAPFGPSALMLN